MIMVPSNHSNFFSLLLHVKLSLLILFATFLVSVLCFLFDGSLSKVIALPTIAIVGKVITIWEAILKKNAMNQSTKLIQKLKQRD